LIDLDALSRSAVPHHTTSTVENTVAPACRFASSCSKMKFSIQFAILSLGVAAVASDPTLVRRDGPTLVVRDIAAVTSVVAQVDAGIKALDEAVKAFTSDPSQVQSASAGLLATLRSGTTTIQNTAPLSLLDALTLQESVVGMEASGRALVGDLAAKKNAFQQAGQCASMRQQVGDLAAAFRGLVDAVVAKVPQSVQAIAADAASGFSNALAQSQANFAPENCANAAVAGPLGPSTVQLATTAAGGLAGATSAVLVPSSARPTPTGAIDNATRAMGGPTAATSQARVTAAAAGRNVVAGQAGAFALGVMALLM
jgi:hypothetical protein